MITLNETEYYAIMRALHEPDPQLEREAIAILKLAMIHGLTRELSWKTTLPAILTKQA